MTTLADVQAWARAHPPGGATLLLEASWAGHTTDGQGFLEALRERSGHSVSGRPVRLLGAGEEVHVRRVGEAPRGDQGVSDPPVRAPNTRGSRVRAPRPGPRSTGSAPRARGRAPRAPPRDRRADSETRRRPRDRRGAATEGDVIDLEPHQGRGIFAGDVGDVPNARRGHAERRVAFASQLQKFFQVAHAQVLAHKHEHGRLGQAHHGRERLFGVVGHLAEQALVQHGGAVAAHQKSFAIGFGAGHRIGPDHAAGAGLVLHQNGRIENLRGFLRDDAGHLVRRAAWRKGDDEPNGLHVLRRGLQPRQQQHTQP